MNSCFSCVFDKEKGLDYCSRCGRTVSARVKRLQAEQRR